MHTQLFLGAYMLHIDLVFCHSCDVVDQVGYIARACVERVLWKCPKCHSLFRDMVSKTYLDGFKKGTISDVIFHASTRVYFEFSGLLFKLSLLDKTTEDKEHTSTGPLRPGKYFLASSPSPYPF